MLAYYTPAPIPPMIRNELLNQLAEQHQYEIVTWPAYYSDEQCMNMLRLNTDTNILFYIAMMNGITPIITVAGHKAFIADLSKKEKSNRHLPEYLNPSYNNTEKEEKHLRDQRSSA